MLRVVTTELLAEQHFTEIRTQKELNDKLEDKGFKNFRHFTIMPWASLHFNVFPNSSKMLIITSPNHMKQSRIYSTLCMV